MSKNRNTLAPKIAIGAAIAALAFTAVSPVMADSQRGSGNASKQSERGAIKGGLRDIIQKRILSRQSERRRALPTPDQTFSYGGDDLQRIAFFRAKKTNADGRIVDTLRNQMAPMPSPLILFVHGGGWSQGDMINATGEFKSGHYNDAAYHFATMNYRLVPEASVEQQAADVASAVKDLIDRADELQIDRERVVLMGHSAGAHLVALVGTDPQYLQAVGLSHDDIAGVIPLDGAAYDVPAQIESTRWDHLQKRYDAAFGRDPARQIALSPTHHAASPNVDEFLILHVERRAGKVQSQGLGKALNAAGTDAKVHEFEGKGLDGHAEINLELGNPEYAATPVVDAWLRDILAD